MSSSEDVNVFFMLKSRQLRVVQYLKTQISCRLLFKIPKCVFISAPHSTTRLVGSALFSLELKGSCFKRQIFFFFKGIHKHNKSKHLSVHDSFGDRFHGLQSLLLCLDREVSIFTQAIKKRWRERIKVIKMHHNKAC